MFKYKISLQLITFLFVGFFSTIQAQLSKKHFIPPLTYAETGNANPENHYFYISTPSTRNVSFTIKQVGSSSDITGAVSSTDPREIFIASGDSQLFVDSRQTSVVHNNKGYIIEADDVIYVSVRVLAGNSAQAGALVSKGAAALGKTFRAGMFTNENPQTNYLSFISVMATEDDTKVNFSGLPTGIAIKNFNGGSTIPEITLNEGESYIVAANSAENIINRDGLIGTLITSDKDIVTNVGSANGSFHNGGARDYGIDQIVGIDKIIVPGKTGSEYIFVKGGGSNGWENILIVAHENNTTVTKNGGGVFVTLNEGEYTLIEGDQYNANGNMFVETSKPAFAYQGIGANGSEANQGLFFVPPLSCENRGKVDNIPNIESIGNVTFDGGITIITNKGAAVNINSQPIANFSPSGPFDVDGNPNYVTYKVTNLTGNISIDSTGELYCAYFNQNGAASSGSFYSGFPSNPEINFDAVVTTLGNCIPNVTLQAANTDLFDSIKWEYFNETTATWEERSTSASYEPIDSEPGRYRLLGSIDCTNSTFESLEIPVSICPDDYDGDLIIDNLDVDLDNDGILNCDESIGNAALNFTDINNPTIVFQDNSTNNTTTSLYTETEVSNSFSGDNNGNFESIINPTANTELHYELKFNQNINFSFTQNKSVNHTITNDEFFILKIGPGNKNITLLDPDDQLLVDTNFDGEFETGITNLSASEIRFKYKANTTGAASTFQFVANQVNLIDFKHQSSGIASTSTFNGNIQLTCFSRDSDGDGIEDMLDLDSNNDGVPDFFESTAQDVSLTGTDTNLDGLDTIFDTVLPNQDTDNDGIPNYLDIDSDNDGIYDIVEAGYGSLDANNDGFLDDANASTVGNNGLLDALETFPDSGILITPLRNSDNTSIIVANRDTFFDFADVDADGDDCFDVIEAGFTGNGSGVLNASPFDIETTGKVKNNADGYTNPNLNYITSAPIVIDTFNDVIFCEEDTNEIEIVSNAESFQWQFSSDNGVTFVDVLENQTIDGSIFTNVTSSKLEISNASLSIHNYQFKVVLGVPAGNICPKTSEAITLTVNPLPVLLNTSVQLLQCADDASEITTVNLTEAEISITSDTTVTFEYYETEANAIAGGVSNQVTDKERYPVNNTAQAWVRIVSAQGCYTIARINVTASFAGDVAYDKTFEECDDFLDVDGNNSATNSDTDGISFFDFSIAEQEVIDTFPVAIRGDIQVLFYESTDDRNAAINEIPDISKHRNNKETNYAFNQTIYIKIKNKNNNDCEGIGKLFLKTSIIPEFSVEGEAPNDPIIICAKNIPYTLEALNPDDNYDYVWTDKDGNQIGNTQSIQISNGGQYTVTAFSQNTKICSRARTIVVQKSSFETIDESFITIKDDTSGTSENLSIQIDIPTNPLINEEFQYALEDEKGIVIRSFQDSNIFNDIEGGIYKILVENKNGCGSSELVVSVLQLPKFFTPNGDGKNDLWEVKGANKTFYTATSSIHIFNRFGKLVARIEIDGIGWDGTYNGKKLPADDYWYSIQLIPTDTSKNSILKKGNFSLLDK